MAFQTTGIITYIGNTEEIPFRDKVFRKRELVLDCSKRNQFTGEVEFPNFPKFEFTGNHVDDLNNFQNGQIVTVAFDLSGRRFEKDGHVNYYTNIQGFKIELYQQRYNQQQPIPQSQQSAMEAPQAAAQAAMRNASSTPSSQPAVGNRRPVDVEKDDLPF